MNTTQDQVTDYVRGALCFPLQDDQLVSMVILHFDIPDRDARRVAIEALKELEKERSN